MFTTRIEGLEENQRAWDETVREIGAGARSGVVLAAKEAVEEAKRTARWKDRSGEARRTITSRLVRDTFGRIEADILAPLARHLWLDEGTKPHEIRPVRARGLRFIARTGETVFAKRVMHPGTRGFGFAGKMYLKAERVLQSKLEETMARVRARWS